MRRAIGGLVPLFIVAAGCRGFLGLDDKEYTLDEAAGGGGESSSVASASGSGQGSSSAQGTGGGSEECAGTAADCTAGVPDGWQRVGYVGDRSSPCGPGFQTEDILADSMALGDACTCGACTLTSKPNCNEGPIDAYYDEAMVPACDLMSVPISNKEPGDCNVIGTQENLAMHFAGIPPKPTGGTCSVPVFANEKAYVSTEARICAPISAACEAELCAGSGALDECIRTEGPHECPSPFLRKHVVSTGVDVMCSDCGCSVEATCVGNIVFYSDTACTAGAVKLAVDGTCVATDPGTPVAAYEYNGVVDEVECNKTVSSTATLTVHNLQTVCCK